MPRTISQHRAHDVGSMINSVHGSMYPKPEEHKATPPAIQQARHSLVDRQENILLKGQGRAQRGGVGEKGTHEDGSTCAVHTMIRSERQDF